MKNWKAIAALVALAGLVYFMVFHWGRFLADFWPFDASRVAPNILAAFVQYAVLLILAALLYPPIRRAVAKYVSGHVEDIKAHITAEHALVHAKLNHVIHHSTDIPPFPTNPPVPPATPPESGPPAQS